MTSTRPPSESPPGDPIDGNPTPLDPGATTPTRTGSGNTPSFETTEHTLRFEYTSDDPNASTVLAMGHTTILHTLQQKAMQDPFSNKVEIFSNRGKQIPEIKMVEWASGLTHSQHFCLTRIGESRVARRRLSLLIALAPL